MIPTEANNISISLNDSTAKLVDGIAGKAANLNNTSVESILNTTGKGNFSQEKQMEIVSGNWKLHIQPVQATQKSEPMQAFKSASWLQ